MQTPASRQPAPHPPIPPTSPADAAATTAATAGTGAVPVTAQEVAALRARRSELSRQLSSAESRRNRLSESLEETDGAARAGLEERIVLLDKRIVQLESDIAETGRQLAAAPAGLLTSTQVPPPFDPVSPMDVPAVVFTIFVLAPLALAAARLMWKRANAPVSRQNSGETMRKLEGLEQAVEAIAIEVERVSESQRFLARLLSEARGIPPLGPGQRSPEPIRVPDAEAVHVPREET